MLFCIRDASRDFVLVVEGDCGGDSVDAALPRWGKGALRVCGATLLAPLGQGRFDRARAGFGVLER